MECGNCRNTEFEPGFLEDRGGQPGYVQWIAGALRRGVFGGAKLLGKARWIVVAQRCVECRHLEFFATERS